MSCQESSKLEKLKSYKIQGQQRPFVDDNLQLQHSEVKSELKGSSPIFFHYSGTFTPKKDDKTDELVRLFEETHSSYSAWKRLQNKLKNDYLARM